jgi:hypothetical protein
MVVTADEFAQGQYKGIEHIYILDFLTRKLWPTWYRSFRNKPFPIFW